MTLEHLSNDQFIRKVSTYISSDIKGEWPFLNDLLASLCSSEIGPRAILQYACCKISGGSYLDLVPLSASMELIHQAIRILDDIQDKEFNNQLIKEYGIGTCLNIVLGLILMANNNLVAQFDQKPFYKKIYKFTNQMGLRLLEGQSHDLNVEIKNLDSYWDMISRKSGASFALICGTGAMCATNDSRIINALYEFGHEIGIIAQLLNDYEGLWLDPDNSDLRNRKFTLPIIYGLEKQHERNLELKELLKAEEWMTVRDQIYEILDSINVKEFVLALALKTRRQAKEKLNKLNNIDTKGLLQYLDVLFINVEELVENKN